MPPHEVTMLTVAMVDMMEEEEALVMVLEAAEKMVCHQEPNRYGLPII
jgi:hypothetical protein